MALLAQRALGGSVAGSRAVVRPVARPLPLLPRRPCQRATKVLASVAATPVKITIQGRRLPVTPAIRDYIEEKITKAVKFYANSVKKVDVTISARGGDTGTHGARQQKVDVTIFTLRHGVVRAEEAEESLYASVDLVCDKISRKLGKIKDKVLSRSHNRHTGTAASDAEFQEYMAQLIVETKEFDEQEELRKQRATAPALEMPESIVRSKVLMLNERMSVEAAIDALEAVGHDFYVFREEASDAVQVVYKRESGGYGILIPQKP